MRDIKNRKSLNLNRETLRSLSKDSLHGVAGGALPQLPQSLACITKYTKQIGDTVYRMTDKLPTKNCSLGQVCA